MKKEKFTNMLYLPLSGEKLKYSTFTFGELNEILYSVYDFNLEVLLGHIKTDTNLSTLTPHDLIFTLYVYFKKSFDSVLPIEVTCSRCKRTSTKRLFVEPIKGEEFKSKINKVELVYNSQVNSLKEYKLELLKIKFKRKYISSIPILQGMTQCDSCKNKISVNFCNNLSDFIKYIDLNYNLLYYVSIISVMQHYGYSYDAIKDLRVAQVETLMLKYEKYLKNKN